MIITIRYYLHAKESLKGTRSLYMDVRCDGVVRLRQATGETLKEKDWNARRHELRTSHPYCKEVNARLDRLRLKVQHEFRETMEAGQAPTAADLRAILRPLRTEKMAKGGPLTVAQCNENWKQDDLRRKNRGVDISKVKERDLQGYNYARTYSQVAQPSRVSDRVPPSRT